MDVGLLYLALCPDRIQAFAGQGQDRDKDHDGSVSVRMVCTERDAAAACQNDIASGLACPRGRHSGTQEMAGYQLEYQDESGAIREEIGLASQDSHKLLISSNEDYGKNEAALIAENGDPVADMLYTCNFLFFALNEAAHATGDEEYFTALESLSDFLTRIQVKSCRHKDVDGAWFRAFDYGRWDYWASNADDGWGAWCTLAGWIQSWIVTTQVMLEQRTSYWDRTSCMDVSKEFAESKWMLNY